MHSHAPAELKEVYQAAAVLVYFTEHLLTFLEICVHSEAFQALRCCVYVRVCIYIYIYINVCILTTTLKSLCVLEGAML